MHEKNCNNCEGGHKANDKKCHVFNENAQIKKLMAEKNVSAFEAASIIVSTRSNQRNYLYKERVYDEEFTSTEIHSKYKPRVTYAEIASRNNKERKETERDQTKWVKKEVEGKT